MQHLLVVNGPNLNLLGTREPETYGSTTLPELEARCAEWGHEVGFEVTAFQSNHEGALIDRLQQARTDTDAIVFNPGAFTHTSYALADTLTAIGIDTVETHISNVEEREPWRRTSLIRPACVGTVYGRGVEGYRWAIRHLAHRTEWPMETIAYGSHDDQVIDVRRPDGPGPHDAVVIVHGGFWQHMWTRDTTEGIAVDLTRRGSLTANVEYRRVGKGGGWPVTLDDVAAAVSLVAGMDDVASVRVLGHSAGGHLAVCAAARMSAPVPAMSVGGVLDLESAIAQGVGSGSIESFLDGADPADASPTVIATGVEAVAMHGTDDRSVPPSLSRSYAAANPDCRLVELPGVGHFEFLERSHPAWHAVVGELGTRR